MRYHGLILLFLTLLFGATDGSAQDLILEGDIYLDARTDQPYSGIYQVRFDNGNLAAVYNLRDGMLHQSVVHYFEDGGIRQTGQYMHNERHGLWLEWNESGRLLSQAQFNNGVKDGIWKMWDGNGVCRRKIEYTQGTSVGLWQSFNEFADLVDLKDYE